MDYITGCKQNRGTGNFSDKPVPKHVNINV